LRKLLLFAMMTTIPAWAGTDIIFPWVTNNENFRGFVVINNLNSSPVEITLKATRPTGFTLPQSETVTRTLEPMEQLVETADNLFPSMGDGSAFMIQLTSSADDIKAGFVNNGTQSESGFSPSQANVIQTSDAANTLFFNYMTVTEPAEGFSAAVVINMGDTDADVEFYAYQNGTVLGDPIVINIPAKTPIARLSTDLAPGAEGAIMVVAHSDEVALLGTVFIFNAKLEPSMANAVAISAVPELSPSSLTFYADIQPMIAENCGTGNCHLGGSNKGGLDLEVTDPSNDPYQNLLSESTYMGLNLIQAGDPDNSYLFRKIQEFSAENDYFGNQMPPSGRTLLTPTQIDTIKQWILDGAAEGIRPD